MLEQSDQAKLMEILEHTVIFDTNLMQSVYDIYEKIGGNVLKLKIKMYNHHVKCYLHMENLMNTEKVNEEIFNEYKNIISVIGELLKDIEEHLGEELDLSKPEEVPIIKNKHLKKHKSLKLDYQCVCKRKFVSAHALKIHQARCKEFHKPKQIKPNQTEIKPKDTHFLFDD